MTARLRLAFNTAQGIPPRDVAALWQVAAGTLPAATRDLALATGAGWEVDGSEGIVAEPLEGCEGLDSLDHVTIAVVVSLDIAAIGAGATCLVSHLPDVAADESILWLLGVHIIDPVSRLCRLFLRWRQDDPDDPAIYLDGPLFVMPEGPTILLASRERTAAGYVGRFAVNGREGGQSVAVLSIGDVPAEMGSVLIMGVPSTETGLLAPQGTIELIEVQARAACLEELELVGRRFAEIGPMMEAAIRRYTSGPMRDVWSSDPTSIVQREFRVEAAMLALVRGELEVIGKNAGPLNSWGELLERWEVLASLPVRAGDGFDDRRLRMARHLQFETGGLEDLRNALAEPLGVDPGNVGIAETSASSIEFVDDFVARSNDVDGYYSSGHDAEAWIKGSVSEWTFTNNVSSTGRYRINRTLSSDDLRWWGRILQIAAYRAPTDAHPPYLLHPTGESGENTLWQTRLTAMTVPADNVLAGLIIGDLEADDWTWIGVVRISSAWTVRWARRIGEDLTVAASDRHLIGPSAWSSSMGSVGASFASTSIQVRETATPGTWEVRTFTGANPDDDDWDVITPTIITGATRRPRWGGLGIVGLGTSVSGSMSADWEYYRERSPNAPHYLTFHVERDPTSGTYDLAAAQAILDRYSPAHVDATVIERARTLVYGDPTTLLDRESVGT